MREITREFPRIGHRGKGLQGAPNRVGKDQAAAQSERGAEEILPPFSGSCSLEEPPVLCSELPFSSLLQS